MSESLDRARRALEHGTQAVSPESRLSFAALAAAAALTAAVEKYTAPDEPQDARPHSRIPPRPPAPWADPDFPF